MTFTPFVALWTALALITAGLALYRKLVSAREEDYIHLGAGEERMISDQKVMARKLDVIDRWGKTLTILTTASGLVLASFYLYNAWLESLR
jgi:hypothetical protein